MCTRWSGHGAPTVTSASASADETNSSVRGDVSTVSSFGRSLDTAPRIAGSSSCRSAPSARCAIARRPAEARHVAGALVHERDRLIDDLDRPPVGLLRAVAPDHEAVLGEHDEPQVRVGADGLADLLGQREAGTDVRDPRGGVTEALAHQSLTVGRAREHVDAVRMRVVDVRGRDERVQQRLDRAPRHRGIELAAREVGDHVLVAHLLALDQRQHLVEPQAGEVLWPHRGEVAARALDPHDWNLAAGVVDRGALGGRVAAAEVRHRAVGAEQVGGEHELREHVLRGPAVGGPQVLGVIDEWRDDAHCTPVVWFCLSPATRSA